MLWNIISWIVIGALAGWIASKIMRTDAEMGAVANIVVGIVGSFIGGFILSLLNIGAQKGNFNLASLLTGILGAVVLLAIINMIRKGRAR